MKVKYIQEIEGILCGCIMAEKDKLDKLETQAERHYAEGKIDALMLIL